MIVFSHLINTPNLGDRVCAPYHYFDFPEYSVVHLGQPLPPCPAVVFGGGAIEGTIRQRELLAGLEKTLKIAWGIGFSRRGRTDHAPITPGFDLCGIREHGRGTLRDGHHYVPCVSCMSPLFDRDYRIEHDVVLYAHGRFQKPIGEEMPTFNNRLNTLEEALSFIGSGETVITNSFHGTYWALLLKRKVVCIPFSSKFYGFRYPPAYCTDGDWRKAARQASVRPDALEDARHHNLKFYKLARAALADVGL